jgi:ATP/maltotriose-dependent transcriptional regulator MalT
MLRDAAPPRRPGEGVPGSVFEMLLARDALLDGNPDAARKLIAAADRDVLGTRLVEAMIVHVTESEDRAIAMLAGLSEQTRGLRQADIARLALIASMLHASGDDRSAANALRQLAEHHGELDEIERMSLAQGVEPPTDGGDGVVRRQAGARDAGRDRALTAREHDILLTIAAGLARADGAKSLFVSLNTYKTHLRSLYRKLDARSRAEALLEATRRGLI